MASERIILEEFVEAITLLPNEIRRNFELMKSLDRASSVVLCELSECEKRALQRAKRKLRESSGALAQPGADRRAIIEDPELNAEVESKRYKAQEMVDEKVAIAEQTLEIVEAHLHRLDSDLAQFEAHLRAAGEFETVGAAKEVRMRAPQPLSSTQFPPPLFTVRGVTARDRRRATRLPCD